MSMHRPRAKYPGLLFSFARWSVSAIADTESVLVFEFEGSFEVDETVEMIAAISVQLSSNVTLSAKQCDKCLKLFNLPLSTTLRVREEEVTLNPAGLAGRESGTWLADAFELVSSPDFWPLECRVSGVRFIHRVRVGLSNRRSSHSRGSGVPPGLGVGRSRSKIVVSVGLLCIESGVGRPYG